VFCRLFERALPDKFMGLHSRVATVFCKTSIEWHRKTSETKEKQVRSRVMAKHLYQIGPAFVNQAFSPARKIFVILELQTHCRYAWPSLYRLIMSRNGKCCSCVKTRRWSTYSRWLSSAIPPERLYNFVSSSPSFTAVKRKVLIHRRVLVYTS